MTAAVSSVCGIFTTAIVAVAIIIIALAISGMIFVYAGLDNSNFEKEDVTEWLKIIFKKKDADAGSGRRGW
jgi:hypothetical protein